MKLVSICGFSFELQTRQRKQILSSVIKVHKIDRKNSLINRGKVIEFKHYQLDIKWKFSASFYSSKKVFIHIVRAKSRSIMFHCFFLLLFWIVNEWP